MRYDGRRESESQNGASTESSKIQWFLSFVRTLERHWPLWMAIILLSFVILSLMKGY